MAMAPLSDKARDLIFQFEGVDQASEWPGGASGITIGYGYDLGQESADDFHADWTQYLSPDNLALLNGVLGLKGADAQAKAPSLKSVRVSQNDSQAVFLERSVPKYQTLAEGAFPGIDALPADAQGALLSLVYNRGTSMNGDSRSEMRAVRDAVPNGDLQTIADQIRAMKRLWVGKGLDGLLKRRDAEADLVASCITPSATDAPT